MPICCYLPHFHYQLYYSGYQSHAPFNDFFAISKTKRAFHFAKLTGQRSVGTPEENGTTFFD